MTREEALEILKPHPSGWQVRYLRPQGKRAKFLFENVPAERRHIARQKLDDLLIRWKRDHPGQQMSQGKYASLVGNATQYALYCVTWHWWSKRNLRWQAIWRAKRFLKKLELEEFRAQPLGKRVKRLL